MHLLAAAATHSAWLPAAWLAPCMLGAIAVSRPEPGAGGAAEIGALLPPLLDSAYGTALHLTRNATDAEDLVQEAALLACRGFGTFQPGTNFKAWFFRILTNCFYSTYRKKKRGGTQLELDDTPELYLYCQTAAIGLHGQTEDPARLLMERLDAEQIGAAVDALPEEYRVVATLYFLQDFSYQEIAEVLDVPVGTVRSRLHRGRRMLQKALWVIAEERGIIRDLTAADPPPEA
ncbi:MAG: sigma-70 family RNA polymerase sigma factor [Gemmatimonadetes bacterium]|nr:sigma-70 family RNA polymerase sigma factor [Gemmatimonadota bacterium]